MNLKKVNKLLKKINNLHQSILDDETISSIEKELFLSYVKSLYEAAIEGEESDNQKSSLKKKSKKSTTKPVQSKVEMNTEVEELSILDELEEIKPIEIPKVKKNVPVAEPISIPEPQTEYEVPVQKEAPIAPVEVIKEIEKTIEPSNMDLSSTSYDNMADLFASLEVKELSAKLANAPIKSIKSKLGINERLLTVKELFASDTAIYNQTIETLDEMSSFEEAKKYLAENVVNKFDWMSDSKMKKAMRFVQLVQRRYL